MTTGIGGEFGFGLNLPTEPLTKFSPVQTFYLVYCGFYFDSLPLMFALELLNDIILKPPTEIC